MEFGPQSASKISNPVYEPLWRGERTIVEIVDDSITVHDELGDELAIHEDLRASLAAMRLAAEIVLDGYLVPAPIRGSEGALVQMAVENLPSASEMGRQMLVGTRSSDRDRMMRESEARRRYAIASESPAAFIAIDLLSIDGQSLLDVPLLERKRLLEAAIGEDELVRRTMMVRPPVEAWLGQWKALGFSEIAVKDANSRYVPGATSRDWAIALVPRR
jgi:hypothetical protein